MSIEELQELPGVGPATARALASGGFVDREAIASGSVDELVGVRGVGEAKAAALIDAARTGRMTEPAPDAEGTRAPNETDGASSSSKKKIERLRIRHADLKKRAKKARKKAKSASSKKKRKRWMAEADKLAKKAKKAKKKLESPR